jgi:hypothetical protein
MVDQHPFLEDLICVDNNTFLFQQHFKAACDLLSPLTHACFLSFEQLIMQQMVQLQNSISECLHHHFFFNMFFKKIFEAHCAWISSCSNLGVGTWFITWLVFPTFQLSFPIFSITLCTRLGLPHPSIACIPWCVCTHPIDPMGIHLLCCAYNNKRTRTHDAIHNTFATIARDVGFHMGWKQLQVFLSITFNSSRW